MPEFTRRPVRLDWPSREDRETWEVRSFIEHYRLLPERCSFEIERRQQRPDWILRDTATGELVGVELTSIYIDDRSVPDVHRRPGYLSLPYHSEEVVAYGHRIADTVRGKVRLARGVYETGLPLLLSIYANEYLTIHMDEATWASLVREHESTFDDIAPFLEVVIWPLRNVGILRIRPGVSGSGASSCA